MKVFWKDEEKAILIRESSETLSWDDYDSSIQKTYEMLREVKHDVYLIFDASLIGSVPKDALEHFSKAARNLPPNVALRIIVTRNKVLQTLIGVLQKVMPENFNNVRYASSMEDAYTKVAEDQRRLQKP